MIRALSPFPHPSSSGRRSMRRNAPSSRNELPRLLWISALIMLLGICAFAQETTGSITGIVTDPSGAAIPNAKVEISGPAMVRTASATTDGTGTYNAGSIPAGQYIVAVTSQGFGTMRTMDVGVVLGRATRV